jgi:mRNA interferase MazF
MPEHGDVWWCHLPDAGHRPVVVLSRTRAIPRMRRVMVAPCTTTIRGLDTEVHLGPHDDPVPRHSAVNLDSVHNVALAALERRIGRLSDARLDEICRALAVAVDCRMAEPPLDMYHRM